MAMQAHVRSKTTVVAAAEGGLRPLGLRPPTSRAGASGIAVPWRASAAGSGGGAMMSSTAVGGGGRLGGLSGVARMGLAKGDGAPAATARMMRRNWHVAVMAPWSKQQRLPTELFNILIFTYESTRPDTQSDDPDNAHTQNQAFLTMILIFEQKS